MTVKIIEDPNASAGALASIVIDYLKKHADLNTAPDYLIDNGFEKDTFGVGHEPNVLFDPKKSGVERLGLLKKLIFPTFHRECNLKVCEIGKVSERNGAVNVAISGQEYGGKIYNTLIQFSKENKDFPDINIILWEAKPRVYYPGRNSGV